MQFTLGHGDLIRLSCRTVPSCDYHFKKGQLPSGLFRMHSGPARAGEHSVTLHVFDKGQMNPGAIGGAL